MRPRACFPAYWLAADGAKNALRYPSALDCAVRPVRRRQVPGRTCEARPWGGGGEDEASDQGRPPQYDLLGDEAADGEPEQICLAELEGADKGDRIPGHLIDRVRRRAGQVTDAGVVEGDGPVGLGERVDQCGIPVVQVVAEVLEQDERDGSVVSTGVPVRVADAVRCLHGAIG
jgi:hypothetical protein